MGRSRPKHYEVHEIAVMKIGIVLHPYGEEKPAGLGRAVFEITRGLIQADPRNEYMVFLRRSPKILPSFSGKNWRIKICDYRFLWLDRALWGENLDVCIFNTPIISFFVRPKKSIVVAYDFAYEHFGPKFFLKLYQRFSLKTADLILAISEATKEEAVRLFNVPRKKVKVLYLGYDKICEIEPRPVPTLPQRFFFFVGAIKERKNVLGVTSAFKKFRERLGHDYKLVIAGHGRGDYYERICRYVRGNNLSNEVIFLGHISDGELSWLYKKAHALVYPSFIEGFGFPVLEAMSCGLPVITSNCSSLPEVADGAALLVDPYKIDEIALAMEKLAKDSEFHRHLVVRGYEQAKKFSWEKTTRELLYLMSGKEYDRAV